MDFFIDRTGDHSLREQLLQPRAEEFIQFPKQLSKPAKPKRGGRNIKKSHNNRRPKPQTLMRFLEPPDLQNDSDILQDYLENADIDDEFSVSMLEDLPDGDLSNIFWGEAHNDNYYSNASRSSLEDSIITLSPDEECNVSQLPTIIFDELEDSRNKISYKKKRERCLASSSNSENAGIRPRTKKLRKNPNRDDQRNAKTTNFSKNGREMRRRKQHSEIVECTGLTAKRKRSSTYTEKKFSLKENPAQPKIGDIIGGGSNAISSANLGHKMLRMMGWKPGDTLGSSAAGILEPIQVVVRARRTGLGV